MSASVNVQENAGKVKRNKEPKKKRLHQQKITNHVPPGFSAGDGAKTKTALNMRLYQLLSLIDHLDLKVW